MTGTSIKLSQPHTMIQLSLSCIFSFFLQNYFTICVYYLIYQFQKSAVMHNFEDLKVFGEGSFSIVYQARRKLDGKQYAIKKMKLSCLSTSEKLNCLNEIRLLARLSHPNIIQYREAFFEEDHLCLVMEFAERGDFLQLMMQRSKKKKHFSEEEFCVYAREMANGINGLHRTNILHRDVKAANFFLVGEQIKIGDMNVSSISKDGMANTKIGTPYYTSPQIWEELPYSFKSDIWSLGCLFYEMVTFVHPFSGRDVSQLKKNILTLNMNPLPHDTPEEIVRIIRSCLRKDPRERPTSQELLSNPYLKRKYNEYKQKTMEKSLMNDRQHKMTCIRILRDINCSGTCEVTKATLPKSNYFTVSKDKSPRKTSKIKGKISPSRKVTKRLLTMFNIYNQKPPGLLKKNTKVQHIR